MSQQDLSIQMQLRSRGKGEDLAAFGSRDLLLLESDNVALWDVMQAFIDKHKGSFIFKALAYELKDSIEKTRSENPSFIPCPLAILFVPSLVLKRKDGNWEVIENDGSMDVAVAVKTLDTIAYKVNDPSQARVQNSSSLDRSSYLSQLASIKSHIQLGDIYEMSFCQEFRWENVALEPLLAFQALLEKTNAPYSCYFQFQGKHLLCASPESYLEKNGRSLISRPIKGTRKRHGNPDLDLALKKELEQDPKERVENIMICDLVRNDLSKVALRNSVQVDELCKVYSFDTVHQMISSISCKISPELPLTEVFKASFPMGSMTGAPKLRAMELIESHEDFKRGWFSGSLGYISPDGDMKSNVVIRSILYDEVAHKASVAAGGAITSLSDPEAEYEESLLKAEALKEIILDYALPQSSPQVG